MGANVVECVTGESSHDIKTIGVCVCVKSGLDAIPFTLAIVFTVQKNLLDPNARTRLCTKTEKVNRFWHPAGHLSAAPSEYEAGVILFHNLIF